MVGGWGWGRTPQKVNAKASSDSLVGVPASGRGTTCITGRCVPLVVWVEVVGPRPPIGGGVGVHRPSEFLTGGSRE